MIKTDRLKRYVVFSELTQTDIAKKMGITLASLNNKLNGKRDFNGDELQALIKILGLSPAEAGEALFS